MHYFYGSSDWYIAEIEYSESSIQAFGYAILNGDLTFAEWGYISINELLETNKIELDFHFKPRLFGEIQKVLETGIETKHGTSCDGCEREFDCRNCVIVNATGKPSLWMAK